MTIFRYSTRIAIVAGVLSLAFGTGCSTSGRGTLGVAGGTATASGSGDGLGLGIETGTTTGTGTGTGSVTSIGSGTGSGTGGLTQVDINALNKAANTESGVEPSGDDSGLSAKLQAAAAQLLADEKAGHDVAAQKIALAGDILAECANKVAPKAPIPGQPFMGAWNGGGQCAVAFNVGEHAGNGKYGVSGGTNGTLQADQQGRGAITADPFSGNVVDSGLNGKSGAGTLTHPTFFRTKSGTSPCSVTVTLTTPTSPIPANYQEGMKIAGKCFRQALIFMSPTMDKLFKNMDPALRAQLQRQFLGIGH